MDSDTSHKGMCARSERTGRESRAQAAAEHWHSSSWHPDRPR